METDTNHSVFIDYKEQALKGNIKTHNYKNIWFKIIRQTDYIYRTLEKLSQFPTLLVICYQTT